MGASDLPLAIVQDLFQRYSRQKFENKFKILSYAADVFSDVPTGFLGRHETLRVKIQQTSADAPQEVVFFIKSAPSDVASRAKYIEEVGVFRKEVSVYRELLPKLQEGFPDFTAQCYYAKDDILVFEHLGEMGYHMAADRSGFLDFDHLNCALRSLACMHAASIVFEVKNEQTIAEMFPETVEENAYPEAADSIRLVNFRNANETICELIKVMPEYSESDQLERILREFPLRMRKIFELARPSSKYCNVFCHGDLWANNVLFQYENGHPVQSRLVDFQLTRYAPPILDVITWLTIPTSKEFRTNHFDALLKSYYTMLGEFLIQNGLSIKDYIPRKQFEDSVEEFRLCGLIESCLFSHLTILPLELTQTLTLDTDGFEDFFSRRRSEICMKAFNTDEVYRTRLTDMISDIIDNYILM